MPRHFWQYPEFREGARAMLPVAPGIASWGLMTGVAMMKSGLSLTESLAMALLVFAGSSQLAAMPLIIAGAPMWVILATGFCVNLRFVVFSLHLRPYMMHLPLWRRMLGGYLTADLTYVLFTKRYPHPTGDAIKREASRADPMTANGPNDLENAQKERHQQQAFLLGNSLVNWFSWVAFCVAGVLLANLIPQAWGLGFAGILALVGIACSLATSQLRVVSALIAGAAGVVAFALPLRLNILVAIGVAVVVCLSLERFRPTREAKS
ncbi:AzlC family ABC transporter permease [Variovorax sp. PCZ-1]|uniref:AzlC family ABC transporter permease n=1 Tax=Variovorax sp. PCZ-1 TaxID=2835533 RepID=UPI001BD00070|nr:AzlC family ABC transporter permease [Variovorax sp. PCZ-1]MBS7806453.1 AzlC family ABC transporter permease [Variovorax sp. PCZ-1]